MSRYRIADLAQIAAVDCPCGQSRRAFADDAAGVASMHVVDITAEARTHYHKRLTEIYYVLEGSGHIELDGERLPIGPGTAVLIEPGCRHRAIPAAEGATPLRILNVPIPAFDPDDEWFD